MESKDILLGLKKSINQLLNISKNKEVKYKEKESILIKKIVPYFHEILFDNFNKKEQKSPKSKEKQNNYWIFISKHFNTPLVRFCKELEKKELNISFIGDDLSKRGKNWIFLSIIDNTFFDSINEIYNHGWDQNNSILNKNKVEIYNILNEINQIQFDNIDNKNYIKYLEYLKKNKFFKKKKNTDNDYTYSKSLGSPIIGRETNSSPIFSGISGISIIKNKENFDDNITISDPTNPNPFLKDKEEITIKKNGDFFPKIINNFYTFKPNLEKNINNSNNILIDLNEDIDINNKSNYNLKSFIDCENSDELNSSIYSQEKLKPIEELILNPKMFKYLPTDKLYEINEKSSPNKYNKNDNLIYNKKNRQISNCLLLYLNKYYKKTPYFKFYKHNLHNRPISLKEQNYQCNICLKNFTLIFNIPIEHIFWCSYYMRFVCKDCIDNEFSIIPHFVLKKWCFEKFSISKPAKKLIINWYNKPVIYFKKNDLLLGKITQLNKVIKIKKVINNIFDIMKCENKFKYVEDILGEYEYIALKEYLFSLRDLVEINNKTFYKKMKEFKNKFIKHISGECPECLFEGEFCNKCGFDEKIFFYDIENVFYCTKCRKSYHKKCIEIGHIH